MAFWKSLSFFLLLVGTVNGDEADEPPPRRTRRRNLKNDKKGKDSSVGPVTEAVPLVVDRGFTEPGVPVGRGAASCFGVDTVLEDTVQHVLTESRCGYLERTSCSNPYTVSVAQKNDPLTNPSCLNGTCKGCCRDYSFLECDEDGRTLSSWLPCLCSDRTYGGNPYSPPLRPPINTAPPAVQVPISLPPVSAPIPRGGPAPTDIRGTPGSPTNPSSPIDASTLYPECTTNWFGHGLGEKPLIRPLGLPDGLEPGECTAASHCHDTPGQCCLKRFCLCGTPNNDGGNCRT